MNSIFLDSDVIIDWLLVRDPFYKDSKSLFEWIDSGKLKAFTSTLICSHVYYFASKANGHKMGLQSVRNVMRLVFPLAVSYDQLNQALDSQFSDFEDAIQYCTALTEPRITAIVTRNAKDFPQSRLPVYSPAQYLDLLKTQQ